MAGKTGVSSLSKLLDRLRNPSEWLSLFQSVSTTFLIQVGGFGLAYLVNVLLARWLGVDSYGNYVLVYNWGFLISIFGSLGFTSSILRFVPQYRSSGSAADLRGVIRFSALITLSVNIMLVIIVNLALAAIHPEDIDLTAMEIGLWFTPLFALQSLLTSILRGFGLIGIAFAPPRLLRPVLTVIFSYLVIHFVQGNITVLALLALMASILVVLVQQYRALSRVLAQYAPQTVQYQPKYWLKVSIPFLAIESSSLILWRGSLILTGLFLGAPAAALVFTADRLASLTGFILIASNSVFAPMITPLVGKDEAKLERLTMTITRWTFWSSLIASIAIYVFADPLLSLFGSEFVAAKPALLLFLIAQLLVAVTGPVGQLLNYSGHEMISTRIGLTTSLLALGSGLVVIPLYGIEGVAMLLLVAQLVKNGWTYLEVRRRLGINSLMGVFDFRRSISAAPIAQQDQERTS
jgi:O-antigen/teichoic acid export membrane protein